MACFSMIKNGIQTASNLNEKKSFIDAKCMSGIASTMNII